MKMRFHTSSPWIPRISGVSFFIVQVRPMWKLHKNLFAGLNLEYTQNVLWDVNPHMTRDPNYIRSGQYIVNNGIGAILSYDSWDFPQNAYRGFYSTLIFTFYEKATGGNQEFRALDFDTRYFLPLSKRKIRTLAFNWRSRYDFGPTPFTSLVSPGDVPGSAWFCVLGQFRDQYA